MLYYDISGLICSLLLLCIACVADMKTKRIPNWITFTGLGVAVCLNIYFCAILGTGLFSIVAIRLALLVCVFLFGITGLIGMGDIKLIMGLSLLNEPVTLLGSIALACALLVIFQLLTKGKAAKDKAYTGMFMVLTKHKMDIQKTEENTIPFVPYLLLGYVIIQIIWRVAL